ncbi:hypothetical protein BSKO_04236 [Bryopsis sp. KO-2023]|nr:hypothetical protein BSKO_04236 [Bryopsis sp. KO-2023]
MSNGVYSEGALQWHFSQFGNLDSVEVVRDKQTGRSRGFGFVNYGDPMSVENALNASHYIEGRRCDVKPAVPRGEPVPLRTRRIFVARIPLQVTEERFREYFERFGRIDDAYMPRDHARHGHRGIGFVTFADPSSTERVMAVRHTFDDHEVVVDRATPKDHPGAVQPPPPFPPPPPPHGYPPMGQSHIPPPPMPPQPDSSLAVSLAPALSLPPDDLATSLAALQAAQFENQMELFQVLREQQQYMAMSQRPASVMEVEQDAVSTSGLVLPPGLMPDFAASPASSGLAALLDPLSQGLVGLDSLSQGMQLDPNFAANLREIATRAVESGTPGIVGVPPPPNPPVGSYQGEPANVAQSVHSVQSSQGGDTGRVPKVRVGPRIFVGKLSKETTDQDLREYFTRYGYVMDVFIPRAKENKKEHRGFGFITFETEAAIQRVVSHGTHKIRGNVIAIDVAVPEEPTSPGGIQRQRSDLSCGRGSSQFGDGHPPMESEMGGTPLHGHYRQY